MVVLNHMLRTRPLQHGDSTTVLPAKAEKGQEADLIWLSAQSMAIVNDSLCHSTALSSD